MGSSIVVWRGIYQRTSRRRWTFHQFHCLSGENMSPLYSSTSPPLTLGEVTTLQHELGDDTMERAVLVSISVLTGGEFTEVLGSLWNNIVVELEDNAAGGLLVDCDIKLDVYQMPIVR